MHINTTLLLVLGLLLVVWLGWTAYVRFGVKEPAYTVLERPAGFEIRQYEPYIVAYTDVQGTHSEALNSGFRILAGYIFGGNTKKESIAMTAPVMEGGETSEKIVMTVPVMETASEKIAMTVPVMEEEATPEKIAMTAPVTEETVGDMRRISFVMPKQYTLESLPTPNDARVQFLEVPAKKYAALRFGWYATEPRVTEKKSALLELMKSAGVMPRGEPIYAGYNDPWSFPLLMRNEILVEVE
jgi:hypothetical protein